MLKRIILVLGFFSIFSTSFAQHENANGVINSDKTEVNSPLSEAEKTKLENKEYIDHHVLDGHSFDIMTIKNDDGTEHHVGFDLPIIFYDKANGFHSFMSTEFEHGEKVVESKGSFYKLAHEKIYKTNAAGTLTLNKEGHAENEKVLDLSLTKSVLMIIVTSIMLVLILTSIARGYKKSAVPSGAGKFLEPIIILIRDDIAKPNIGKKYQKYMSFLLTVFFFILFLNVFGLLPFGINVTGNLAITFSLAILTFIITQFTANGNYWQHIFWMPGLPWWMKIVMMPIEIIGVFIKPFALMIRLFANMSAGHIVMMSLIALIFYFKNIIAGVAFPFLTFVIYLLEILVALLQAYIFTLLSAVYFGMANEEHGHEGEEGMVH
ncbi:MAG: F0F1 ATP synthase subunit A [Chryseobacterium sp.]|nr:F0F1 ATP synthase subunit A [Chryseobacterium sp.]